MTNIKKETLNLGVAVHKLALKLPPEEERGLAELMLSKVGAVAANARLTEELTGEEQQDCRSTAKGALAALETFILICVSVGYFDEAEVQAALNLCAEINNMLAK